MKRLALVIVVIVVGCSSNPTPSQPRPAPSQPPAAATEVAGYWTGDWGQLVLRESGGKITGTYSHDQGTIVGTMNGDTLVGWWCEVPSRKPNHDAGDVELKFISDPDGKRRIDGRWRYGSEENWHDDWDLGWDTGAPAEELTKRFDDASVFCTK